LTRVLGLFAPHRRRVSLLLLTILVGSVAGTAAPFLVKFVFDRALFPPGGHPRLGVLELLIGLIMILVVLTGVLQIVETYLSTRIGQLVMHDLREQLYAHLREMSLGFFAGSRTGEIQSRLSNDVGGVGQLVSSGLITMAANGAILIASLVAMAVLAWPLAALSVPILFTFAFFAFRAGRVQRRYVQASQETLAEMSSIAQETLSVSGALLGKVFDRHRSALDRYRESSRRLVELRVRQQLVGKLVLGTAQTFFLLGPAVVYLAAGIAISDGAHYTTGTVVAVSALLVRLFTPVSSLLSTSIQLQASGAIFDRIFEYLDLPHEISDAPDARTLAKTDIRGHVSFQDVWFRYTSAPVAGATRREWTLREVTLEVERGQLAALVGPSGAGKTTLSYLAARLYDVERGAVRIDGVDVRGIRLASLADLIGMVTQETYLFHSTIRENLLYGRPDAARGEVEAAARLAFIHDRILELPGGYDTVVGERGYRLSGGEKQRLAIARVILKDPRILILDEATSSLDTISERFVQRALQPLMAERTTIAIAHRLSTILAADVIFVLDDGRLVERGTHEELVASGRLYSQLYEEQFLNQGSVSTTGAAIAEPRQAVGS